MIARHSARAENALLNSSLSRCGCNAEFSRSDVCKRHGFGPGINLSGKRVNQALEIADDLDIAHATERP